MFTHFPNSQKARHFHHMPRRRCAAPWRSMRNWRRRLKRSPLAGRFGWLGMTGVTKICFALRKWDGWYKKHICTESVSPYVGFKRCGPWILDLHAFGSLNSFCFLCGKNQWGWWLNKCYLDGRRRHFGYYLGVMHKMGLISLAKPQVEGFSWINL